MDLTLRKEDEFCALIEGDVSSFNAIYNRYFKAIYANVFKIVKSPEYTEEIVQDVFVTLWQSRLALKLDQSIAGWLFKVSFNKSLSFLRQHVRNSIDYVEKYNFFEADVCEDELATSVFDAKLEAVEKAIQLLSPRQKEILNLCKIKGKSKEEVSALLGIAPETVKEHLKQSYRTIRSRIGQNYSNELMNMTVVFSILSQVYA